MLGLEVDRNCRIGMATNCLSHSANPGFYGILLPTRRSWGFAGEIIENPGYSRHRADFRHHFKHHLHRDVSSRRGSKACHEVKCFEGPNNHGSAARRDSLQGRPVEMKRQKYNGHLADRAEMAGVGQNLMC